LARHRATAHRRRSQRGAGLIGTTVGVLTFLLFLLLATQTLVRLYTTSTVSAVTFDAARRVATGTDEVVAEQHARSALGSYGSRPVFHWSVDADNVALTVEAPAPLFLPASWTGLGEIHRTVHVRRETFRS
jgi:hypothetical protein